MIPRHVVCTGLGIICPLGRGSRKVWTNLLESKSGITSIKVEHSFDGNSSKVAAYVPEEDLESGLADSKHSYMLKNAKQLSRATKFAMLAAHEALDQARLLDESGQLLEKFRLRCGVTIGQGMVDFQDIYENGKLLEVTDSGKTNYRRMSPYFMTRALMNMSAGNISIRYKLNGPNHCVSTACATGAHSIGDAFNFIRFNQADVMVCGSTEASINNIGIAGFERLKALSTNFNHNPPAASRPFDVDRCGFVMGEGSGIIVLEEREHAYKRGLKDDDIICNILGYGTSADAYHLTSPSPDALGARLCMQNAINDARVKPESVSHVNAHATSTPIGDDIECHAIEDILPWASVTSNKGAIGHLLGGAGSVESIFAILSCQQALLPHCLNLEEPSIGSKCKVQFIKNRPEKWDSDRRILLKNSFGFGGTNASLVLSS